MKTFMKTALISVLLAVEAPLSQRRPPPIL